MDGSRFDDLTRSLATGVSRRGAIKAVAAGLAGAALGLARLGGASAACRGAGRRCTGDGNCCSGICDQTTFTCACDPGLVNCRGECVDAASYQTDVNNCGTCDHACSLIPTGLCENEPTCQAGVCTFTPQPQGTRCRESAGICDVEEVCDGNSIVCPPNLFRPNTVQCRAGGSGPNAVCDPPEFCSGSSAACPPNSFAAPGTGCETGNLCTTDTCNGSGVCVGSTPVVCNSPPVCRTGPGTCNQADGSCSYPAAGAGTACGAGPSCAGGTQHAQDTCNGSGTCVPGANTPCGTYLCGATACLTTCGNDNQCVASAHCDEPTCLPNEGLGDPCNEDSDCASAVCNPISDICCAFACAAGEPCLGSGHTCGCPPGEKVCNEVCIPDGGCCGDTECPGTQFCELATHLCAPDRPVGGSCTRTCGPLPPSACSTDNMCLSGICLEGDGVCGCATDLDCPTNQWCDSGTNRCMPDLPLSQSCNRPAQCISGVCNGPGPTCGCPSEQHLCGSQCFADDVPTHCGAECLDCPVPENGDRVCNEGVCDVACDAGFARCPFTSCLAIASFPDTPLGAQIAWTIATINSGVLPTNAEIDAHFHPDYIAAFGYDYIRGLFVDTGTVYWLGFDAPPSATEGSGRVLSPNGDAWQFNVQIESADPYRFLVFGFVEPVACGAL